MVQKIVAVLLQNICFEIYMLDTYVQWTRPETFACPAVLPKTKYCIILTYLLTNRHDDIAVTSNTNKHHCYLITHKKASSPEKEIR